MVSYSGPEKYIGKWASSPHFILRCLEGFCIVPDGVDRKYGLPFENLRDARRWMKDNGFEKVKKNV